MNFINRYILLILIGIGSSYLYIVLEPRLGVDAHVTKCFDGSLSRATKIQSCSRLIDHPEVPVDHLHMLLTKRALLHYDSDRNKEAIVDIDRAIQLEPNNATTWTQRAFINNKLGQYDLSDAVFEKALELSPANKWTLSWKATILRNRGEASAALAIYDQILKLAPEDAKYLHYKGHNLEAMGRIEDAIATYEAAIDAQPQSHDSYIHLIEIHRDRGDLDAELDVFVRAAHMWPENRVLDRNIARLHVRLNDYEAAFAHLRNPDGRGYRPNGWLYVAAAYFGIGETEKGKAYVARSVDSEFQEEDQRWSTWLIDTIRRNDRARHSAMAVSYASIGQTELALEALEQHLDDGDLAKLRVLRRLLSKEGFYDGPNTGAYDAATRNATRAYFQSLSMFES